MVSPRDAAGRVAGHVGVAEVFMWRFVSLMCCIVRVQNAHGNSIKETKRNR
jgi:hypothetical protein